MCMCNMFQKCIHVHVHVTRMKFIQNEIKALKFLWNMLLSIYIVCTVDIMYTLVNTIYSILR